MEKMRSQKFNFDFDLTYKELKTKVLKNKDQHTGVYHYLQSTDRFHDVLEKSIKYLEEKELVDQNDFISIFWTAWRFSNLQNHDKNSSKANEMIKTTYVDGFEEGYEGNVYGIDYQPDLDQQELIKKIRTCATVNNVMEGYSVKELSEREGITTMGYYKRYKKELKKLVYDK
jgi:hypothetical protein